MQKQKRAILVSNGIAERPDLLSLRDDDFIIAVDGGMRYLDALGLKPDLLMGDLDSIDSNLLKTL
ncbi:MAG: thiamine diphosphokinase, partial [Chloroflexi bacterium]|nr:thiamine diphosphokinase [Chloroflexota bacterium]